MEKKNSIFKICAEEDREMNIYYCFHKSGSLLYDNDNVKKLYINPYGAIIQSYKNIYCLPQDLFQNNAPHDVPKSLIKEFYKIKDLKKER